MIADYCALDHASIMHLTSAPWPQLETLSLARNALSAADIYQLSKGNWLCLRRLALPHTFCIGETQIYGMPTEYEEDLPPTFMQSMVAASWPQLETLVLSRCHLDAVNMAQLHLVCWPMLHTLDLDANPLCSASFAFLSAAQWPKLESLVLSSTYADASCMFHLGLAQMPCLVSLDMSCNGHLDSAAIAQLVKAQWTTLQQLNLHGCNLDAEAAAELVECNWPQLKVLDVACEDFESAAANTLLLGRWPYLERLEVLMDVYAKSAREYFCSHSTLDLQDEMNYLEDPGQLLNGHWPNLQVLCFTRLEEFSNCFCPPGCNSKSWWEMQVLYEGCKVEVRVWYCQTIDS